MQLRLFRLICITAVVALVAPAFAQMGHPLKGSWSGDWWVKKGDENHVLLDFDWDGKALKGMLNPGTDNANLNNLTLQTPPLDNVSKAMDPWLLHFEADVKDAPAKRRTMSSTASSKTLARLRSSLPEHGRLETRRASSRLSGIS